jgi:putative aldouronate transport system substrate-binding protein
MKISTTAKALLCCLFISLLLAACGDNTPTTAPAAAGTTAAGGATTAAGSAATTAPASSAPVDLSIQLYPANPATGGPPADWEVFKTIKDNLNINLKYTMTPLDPDGANKLNALAASNDLPDFFQVTDRNLFFRLVNQGLLGSTSSLLPLMPERTKLRYSDPALNKLVTVNGTLYALQEPGSATLLKRLGLVIRQDWLDKLGLKTPTTLDDLLAVAKAFTEKDPDGNGKNDTYGLGVTLEGGIGPTAGFGLGQYNDFIYGAYGVAGAWNFSDPAKFASNLRDPNYQKATAEWKKFIDAKVVDPDWATLKLNDYRSRWQAGKYGIFAEDFCALSCSAGYNAFEAANPTGKFSIINPPTGPEGKSAFSTYSSAGYTWVVSKKAIDAGKGPAIAKLLEWANSGEGYYTLGFGKEGLNYKLDADKNVNFAGIPANLQFTSNEQGPISQFKWLAYNGNQGELAGRYPTYETSKLKTKVSPLDYYKLTFNGPNVDATPILLIQPIANQADLNRYISENLVQFLLGQKPLTDAGWAQFLKGLDSTGLTEWETSAKKTLQQAGFAK